MKLEEYILKRKKEDGINELDLNKKTENTQICVNYVFEYFNNYLDSSTGENSTLLHNEKLDKYRHMLIDYIPEIQDWLVSLYSSYGKHMHRQIDKYITDPFYLLYTTDSEFRSLSYDLYSSLIKKFKFLENQSEMLFLFLKDHQRVKNLPHEYDKNVFITADINEWMHSTYKEYGVNLLNFANDYIGCFDATPELWPKGHSFIDKKRESYYKVNNLPYSRINITMYDYKQKSNIFALNSLYDRMPKKSFVRGKKQSIEILLMYVHLHNMYIDEDYWLEYINRFD